MAVVSLIMRLHMSVCSKDIRPSLTTSIMKRSEALPTVEKERFDKMISEELFERDYTVFADEE